MLCLLMSSTVRESVPRHQSDSPAEEVSGNESAHSAPASPELLDPSILSPPSTATTQQTPGSIPQRASHLRFSSQQVEYL